ncbi:unnamed protein product [Adineta steineri]|uniref:Transmembrane protein n=1 Tax=Adineta steineri TaxID=433720 RepID=A0A818GP72_9BILA|nr:unnamed protein product [Adineta steineri]
MSSKFIIYTIFFFEFISIWRGCNGDCIGGSITPNVTGLIPNLTISQTTSLYATAINMTLTIYQSPVNNTGSEISLIINGSTNVDSTNRCIAYGVMLSFFGQYPIINSQATGNGGCDAILGSECSQSILNLLQQSFGDINSENCGVPYQSFLINLPKECTPQKNAVNSLLRSILLNNGSFTIDNSSTANSSDIWTCFGSFQARDFLMKPFALAFFVGRPYSSGSIDSAIACFSTDNTTIGSNTTAQPSGMATQLFVSGNFLIFLSLLHFFSLFMVYLP